MTSNGSRPPTSDRVRRPSVASPDQPFDPEELEAALQKTTLDPTKEVDTPVERSGEVSPSNNHHNHHNNLDQPLATPLDLEPYGPEPPLRPRERMIVFDDDDYIDPVSDPRRNDTF